MEVTIEAMQTGGKYSYKKIPEPHKIPEVYNAIEGNVHCDCVKIYVL